MIHWVKKIGLSLSLKVRNKQWLQRGGRTLSSGHEKPELQSVNPSGREKQFLYCLGNAKDLHWSILCITIKKNNWGYLCVELSSLSQLVYNLSNCAVGILNYLMQRSHLACKIYQNMIWNRSQTAPIETWTLPSPNERTIAQAMGVIALAWIIWF